MPRFNRKTAAAIAAVLAALAALVVQLGDDAAGPPAPAPPATVTPAPTSTPAPDVDDDLAADVGAYHEGGRDELPGAGERIAKSRPPGLTAPAPSARRAPPNCRDRYVRNRSSREGARVLLFVVHLTVSRPGSLDAIRRYFDTPASQASSTFGLEVTGRCEQWVPAAQKPWTQGAFNRVSESVEIIAMGTEPRSWWLRQPIIRQGTLARLIYRRLRANGLPIRWVDPSGCGVQRAGATDHNALECGNNHHDVAPNFPYGRVRAQLRRLARGLPVPALV